MYQKLFQLSFIVLAQIHSQVGGPDGFFFGDLRIAAIKLLFKLFINIIIQLGLTNNFDDLKITVR